MWPFRRKAAHVPESSSVQAKPEMSDRERQYHESNQWGR